MADGRLMAGKYQLLRKIAQGGMAEVYLCKQTGLEGFEKLVVIKRILPHLVENDEFVRMFLDEARTAADLRHPNVVQIFEIGEDQRTYFIAMEFLHGQDVRKILRRQAEQGRHVPLQHALQIVIDAANGLDYAHKKTDLKGNPLNIIHRDISPQNIIVTYDGTTKIVDFGIAKAASQSVETKSGVLKGKYSYMSPEQASGEVLDQRTDQFALGIVLYELTTMTRLFKKENEIMTLHSIIECEVTPPGELVENYPPALSDIVMKALAKKRQDRFKDLRGLADALEEFLAEERVLHSPSRLSGYVQELFKTELAQEKAQGLPVTDQELSGVENQPGTANQRRNTNNRTPARNDKPTNAGDLQNEGTQVTASAIVESATSPSRKQARAPVPAPEPEPPPERSKTYVTSTTVRTTRKLSWAAVALGGLIITMAAGVGGYLMFAPAVTSLTVRTKPVGAKVVVDGIPHPEPTPTIIREMAAGTSHAVRVELAGFAPAVKEVAIPDGKPVEVEFTLVKESARAVVRLKTTPPGARAYLDSTPLDGVTPLELPPMTLDGDMHTVTFSLEGHLDESKRFSLREGVQEVAVTLEKEGEDSAKVSVSSTPEGAAIVVNGKPVGTTPLARPVVVAGGRSVTVTASLKGYETQERLIDVEKGASADVAFELEKEVPQEMGYLTLETTPETSVFTDRGKALGKTPLKRIKVPAGTLSLRFVNEAKGVDYSDKLRIAVDDELKKTITIPRGKLRVVVKPWADVYLDGVKIGQTPLPPRDVYVGRHELRLKNDKLKKDEKRTITVEPGDKNRIKVDW